ncbi:MAG: cytochrome P450 [Acidimicrobiales bacterium]
MKGAKTPAGPDLTDIDLTDLDLFAAGFPDDVFSVLRRCAPVWWHEPTAHTPDDVGFWVASSHRHVLEAVSDAQAFSSERAPGAEGGGTLIQDLPYGFAAGVLLNMTDDPRHHDIRRLVTPCVSPRALADLEGELRVRTTTLLDDAREKGQFDFLMDVAVELPLQATAILLGVPEADRHDLMAWSNATLDYESRELGETSAAASAAAAASAEYGRALVADRKRHPDGDDMLSALVRGGCEDELVLLMFFSLLVTAGSETTRNAIALGALALIEDPRQLAALRADPRLLPGAVEEILRWTSPTTYNRRTATRSVDLGGQALAAGDKVTLWWASANRDEDVFTDPFRFDIRRAPNPHLAFGYKTHFCLGAALARMEIRLVIERLPDMELTGPVTRFRTNKHAGVRHMPVRLR